MCSLKIFWCLVLVVFVQAVALADEKGEVTLFHFGAEWCPECVRMDIDFFEDAANHDVLDRFAEVKNLDADNWDDAKTFADFYVPAIPYLVGVRPDGTTVDVWLGYPGKQELRKWLTNVSNGKAGGLLPSGRIFRPKKRAEAALAWAMQGTPTKAEQYISLSWPGPVRLAAQMQIAKLKGEEDGARWFAEEIIERPIGPWTDMALSVCPEHYAIVLERPLDLGIDEEIDLISTAISGAKQAEDGNSVRRLAEMEEEILEAEVEKIIQNEDILLKPNSLRWRMQQLSKVYRLLGKSNNEHLIHIFLCEIWPEDSNVFLNRSKFLIEYSLGSLDKAELWARHGLFLTSGKGDTFLKGSCTLASILYRKGEVEEARAILEEAMHRAPNPIEGNNFTNGYWQGVIRRYLENPETMSE